MNLYMKEVELMQALIPMGTISREKAFEVFKTGFACHGVDLNSVFANALIYATGYGMSDHSARVANLYIQRMGLPLKAVSTTYSTKCFFNIQYVQS